MNKWLQRRNLLKWAGAFFSLLTIIIFIFVGPTANEYLHIMSAHAAKISCSERFIAGRATEEIVATDIHQRAVLNIPAFRLIQVVVDESQQRTDTSLLGIPIYRDQAVYREGLGCVLVRGQTAEALQAVPGPTINMKEQDGIWPLGNTVDYQPNAQLEQALENAFFDPQTGEPNGTRAVVVVHKGQIIGERYAEGFQAMTPLLGWSMSKTVTAALVGIILEESSLSIDSTHLFPEWQDERSQIRLRDLLSMSDGLDFVNDPTKPSDELRQLYFAPDTVAYALAKPAAHPPNEVFNYSEGSTALVMGIMRQHFNSDQAWINFPYERLFEPIGMTTAVFESDAQSNFVGASWLYASARDWARFGLLLLQDGEWFGEQLLPQGWSRYMASPNTTTNGGWYGNGFIWRGVPAWNMGVPIPEDDYWLNGFDGQMVIVIPSQELVIVRMGFTPNGGGQLRPPLVGSILEALAPEEM